MQAYRQAAQLAPTSALLAALFAPIAKMTYADGSTARLGTTNDATRLRFVSLPSRSGDTLAFAPIPIAQFAAMGAGSVPVTFMPAVRIGREVREDITRRWVERDRRSADAWFEYATALELAGRVSTDTTEGSAGWALAKARAFVTSPALRARIAIAQTRTFLRTGDIRDAVSSAKNAIADHQKNSLETNKKLAPLAAFLGDIALTEKLGSAQSYAPKLPAGIANAIFAFHVRSAIGDCRNIADRGTQLIAMIRNNSTPAEAEGRVDSILKPVFREAATCNGYDALKEFRSAVPLDDAYKLIALGEVAKARARLKTLQATRSGATAASITWDYRFKECLAFLQARDSVEGKNAAAECVE